VRILIKTNVSTLNVKKELNHLLDSDDISFPQLHLIINICSDLIQPRYSEYSVDVDLLVNVTSYSTLDIQ